MYNQQLERILEKMNRVGITPDNTISADSIHTAEAALNITFPESYKVYLTQIQNGGASNNLHVKGPYYGIYSLEKSIAENEEWQVEVAKPFALTNDFEFEEACIPEANAEYKKIIDIYQNTAVLQGTIPICEYGCGDFFRLVVTGANRGEIWVDSGIINLTGYYSLQVDILTFYENWLNRQLLIQQDASKKLINAWYSFLEFGNNNKYKVVE